MGRRCKMEPTTSQLALIGQIAERASNTSSRDRLSWQMDLHAFAMCVDKPLNLEGILASENLTFTTILHGVLTAIDAETRGRSVYDVELLEGTPTFDEVIENVVYH